eukprot:TRINITY_DN5198_c0_g1_i1.p1 TRINITY_DN5198_c0_g1~~TRINITY_DN5198_c0_g1_i1.p1  ORF type:complete len:209 (-),score=22.35 TRINITY_DN5198_c0_g1_i1:120-746(-)
MGNCNQKKKGTAGEPGLKLKGGNDEPVETTNSAGYDFLFKVLLIGDKGVGKTTLILRYTEGKYPTGVPATLSTGVDMQLKTLKVGSKVVKLQLWDTAGQEEFRTISSSFYRSSQAIVLAYSVDDATSFANLKTTWRTEIERYSVENCAKILVGCKSDLPRQVQKSDVDSLCEELGIESVELSSKTGADGQIEIPFQKLATALVDDAAN